MLPGGGSQHPSHLASEEWSEKTAPYIFLESQGQFRDKSVLPVTSPMSVPWELAVVPQPPWLPGVLGTLCFTGPARHQERLGPVLPVSLFPYLSHCWAQIPLHSRMPITARRQEPADLVWVQEGSMASLPQLGSAG